MACMGLVVTGQVCTTGGGVVVAFVAAIMLTVALATLLRASGSVLDFPDTHLTLNWHWSISLSQRHSLELVCADRAQCTSGLWSVWSSTVNFELAIRKVRHCLHAFTRANASRSPVERFISGGVNFALNHSSAGRRRTRNWRRRRAFRRAAPSWWLPGAAWLLGALWVLRRPRCGGAPI